MQVEFDRNKLIAFVEERGRERAKEQGAAFSEVDYLAGAMSVLFGLGLNGEIPGAWVLDVMAGMSPLGIEDRARDIFVVTEGRKADAYVWGRDASAHADMLEESGIVHSVQRIRLYDTLSPEVVAWLEEEDEGRSQASGTDE